MDQVAGARAQPRPRDRIALADDKAWHACRTAVLDFLYRKQRNPALQEAA